MGLGINMSIGWPNNNEDAPLVYFKIIESCRGTIERGITTQLVNSAFYSEGAFVHCIEESSRVHLGPIQEFPGNTIWNIDGPVYTACKI